MINKAKGTRDILPNTSYKWKYVEDVASNIFSNYGYKEIRVPVFENTELFERGVGETTDVVQKEMYTFDDKAGRSITLRPEGTAGVVRAYLENGMGSLPSPLKLWYAMPMYRYENVQKGRYREFRQIGAELIGTSSYLADIEIILMADALIKKYNIANIVLNINSIGCANCRKEYQKALKEYINSNIEYYCDTCKNRLEKNPMRILDCKEKKCKKANVDAPRIIDYLCDECKEHFEKVKEGLTEAGIEYQIDPNIVRGLDYYTKTVFEFVSNDENYTVLGGGRYDDLVKEFGGPDTPAIGFAMGEDRLIEVYEKYNKGNLIQDKTADIYIANIGEKAEKYASKLVRELRNNYIFAEKDISGRSLNAQMKYANKTNAKYALILGDNEVESQKAKIKNMRTGKEKELELDVRNIIIEIQ